MYRRQDYEQFIRFRNDQFLPNWIALALITFINYAIKYRLFIDLTLCNLEIKQINTR